MSCYTISIYRFEAVWKVWKRAFLTKLIFFFLSGKFFRSKHSWASKSIFETKMQYQMFQVIWIKAQKCLSNIVKNLTQFKETDLAESNLKFLHHSLLHVPNNYTAVLHQSIMYIKYMIICMNNIWMCEIGLFLVNLFVILLFY